jgi:hypothetical protein
MRDQAKRRGKVVHKKEASDKKTDLEFVSGKISKIVNRNLDAYCAIVGCDKGNTIEEAIAYFLQAKGLEPYKAPAGVMYEATDETAERSAVVLSTVR